MYIISLNKFYNTRHTLQIKVTHWVRQNLYAAINYY